MEPKVPVRHHPQVALTHRGKDRCSSDGVWEEMLELDAVVEAERPHEAAWRGSKVVVMELGEGDDVATWRVRFLVIRRQRNPFRLRRGNTRAQKPLLLQVPQPALRHGQQAPIVSGDESHGHLGRRWKVALQTFSLEGALCFKKARGCRRARARAMTECGRDSSRAIPQYL